nr:hypothetical protein CFP56_03425 [Quercus suber]
MLRLGDASLEDAKATHPAMLRQHFGDTPSDALAMLRLLPSDAPTTLRLPPSDTLASLRRFNLPLPTSDPSPSLHRFRLLFCPNYFK